MNRKNKNITAIICAAITFISAFFGAIVILIGVVTNSLFVSDTDKSLNKQTKGQITSLTYYDTYVRAGVSYEVDDTEYNISPCFSPDKVVVGKTVTVRYKSSSPEIADVSKAGIAYSAYKFFLVVGWILIGIGIAFAVVAVCFFVSANGRRHKDETATE